MDIRFSAVFDSDIKEVFFDNMSIRMNNSLAYKVDHDGEIEYHRHSESGQIDMVLHDARLEGQYSGEKIAQMLYGSSLEQLSFMNARYHSIPFSFMDNCITAVFPENNNAEIVIDAKAFKKKAAASKKKAEKEIVKKSVEYLIKDDISYRTLYREKMPPDLLVWRHFMLPSILLSASGMTPEWLAT